LGSQLDEGVHFWYALTAFLVSGTIAYITLGSNGLCCLTLIMVATVGYQTFFTGKLGGITGNVLGCVNERKKALFLLTLSAFFKSEI
jgi:adenosylcobinamide-GDP ribazoletransferase